MVRTLGSNSCKVSSKNIKRNFYFLNFLSCFVKSCDVNFKKKMYLKIIFTEFIKIFLDLNMDSKFRVSFPENFLQLFTFTLIAIRSLVTALKDSLIQFASDVLAHEDDLILMTHLKKLATFEAVNLFVDLSKKFWKSILMDVVESTLACKAS